MPNYDPTKLVGSSTTPTLYRMTLPKEGEVYVKCGADILINGLKTDLRAEAQCPYVGPLRVSKSTIDESKILPPKTQCFMSSNSCWARDAWASSVNQPTSLTRKIA